MARRARWFVVFVSVILILGGIATVRSGQPSYHNVWGGTVFAPAAIFIGLLLFVCGLFFWPRLWQSFNRSSQPSSRSPHDDWRKW